MFQAEHGKVGTHVTDAKLRHLLNVSVSLPLPRSHLSPSCLSACPLAGRTWQGRHAHDGHQAAPLSGRLPRAARPQCGPHFASAALPRGAADKDGGSERGGRGGGGGIEGTGRGGQGCGARGGPHVAPAEITDGAAGNGGNGGNAIFLQ
eukprot:365907-Chlamydomonas_euryale.AAC.23